MTSLISVVRIDRDGNILAVYSDAISPAMHDAGEVVISRASHVEPDGDGWSADLSPVKGPKLGPFATRAEALTREVEWLHANIV